jgi:hypothetical protein
MILKDIKEKATILRESPKTPNKLKEIRQIL